MSWAGWSVLVVASMLGLAGLVILALLRRRLVVVTVLGASMRPTYADGDRVVVRRVVLSAIRPGQVVVIEQPDGTAGWCGPPLGRPLAGRSWMIKRAVAVPGDPVPRERAAALAERPEACVPADQLVVLGDNPGGSYDSRVIGYIPGDRVLGVVVRQLTAGRAHSG
jgi:signal peptidase I